MKTKENALTNIVEEIAAGYRGSQILLTANRLGLFAALGEKAMTSIELAKALDADPRGIRILCDALASLSLLDKIGNAYQNSQAALKSLIPGAPQSKTALLLHSARLYEKWGKLYDAVKKGTPAREEDIDPRLISDETAFAKAMADVGRLSAIEIAEKLDLSGVKKLLDIGGGPGLYSIEFARRNPELRAVILDNEKTLKVAQQNIQQAGLSDRVSVQAVDALEDNFGQGCDYIFISNVIHSYSAIENAALVVKCAKALAPKGHLCIKDFMLDSTRTQPQWCALFAINMLVNTESGDCYTREEVRHWMQTADLEHVAEMDVCGQSHIIVARKK
ncbi:MAG: methyltransferase [Candidatus Omnitrophota bacterium]